jgi:DNA-binding IclR family transcriptional regulator
MNPVKNETPLSRYIQILEAVSSARTGVTLTEIGRQLDLPPPTVHRLVGGLKDLDLLANHDGGRSYVLGRRLQNMLYSTLSKAEYSYLAKSILRKLVDELGETVHLAKLNGNNAESVLMEQPNGSNRAFVQPGRELPLHAAASGKAILAFQNEVFITHYFALPRAKFTQNTKVSEKILRRELTKIRKTGIAICDNELDFGVLSYAHPIRVKGGDVLYSIGVTGLADRFSKVPMDDVVSHLANAAALLSNVFGANE